MDSSSSTNPIPAPIGFSSRDLFTQRSIGRPAERLVGFRAIDEGVGDLEVGVEAPDGIVHRQLVEIGIQDAVRITFLGHPLLLILILIRRHEGWILGIINNYDIE